MFCAVPNFPVVVLVVLYCILCMSIVFCVVMFVVFLFELQLVIGGVKLHGWLFT